MKQQTQITRTGEIRNVTMLRSERLTGNLHGQNSVERWKDLTRADFLVMFNADKQIDICRNPADCWFGRYPTLSQVDMIYGLDTAEMWLTAQLNNLMEYCGCKVKLNELQLDELSAIIYCSFGYLRISEIMYFFWNFKAGKFEKFYGAMDPIKIMDSLEAFVNNMRTPAYEAEERRILAMYEDSCRSSSITEKEYLEGKGVSCTESMLDKIGKIEQTKPHKTYEDNNKEVLDSALALVNNRYGYTTEILSIFCKAWEKAHGITPAEYVRIHGK